MAKVIISLGAACHCFNTKVMTLLNCSMELKIYVQKVNKFEAVFIPYENFNCLNCAQ